MFSTHHNQQDGGVDFTLVRQQLLLPCRPLRVRRTSPGTSSKGLLSCLSSWGSNKNPASQHLRVRLVPQDRLDQNEEDDAGIGTIPGWPEHSLRGLSALHAVSKHYKAVHALLEVLLFQRMFHREVRTTQLGHGTERRPEIIDDADIFVNFVGGRIRSLLTEGPDLQRTRYTPWVENISWISSSTHKII